MGPRHQHGCSSDTPQSLQRFKPCLVAIALLISDSSSAFTPRTLSGQTPNQASQLKPKASSRSFRFNLTPSASAYFNAQHQQAPSPTSASTSPSAPTRSAPSPCRPTRTASSSSDTGAATNHPCPLQPVRRLPSPRRALHRLPASASIRSSGITTGNLCSSINLPPKPGELLLFEIPKTYIPTYPAGPATSLPHSDERPTPH